MMSWLSLENKTYIVTGARSGIGLNITKTLLENGANVVISDINKEEFVLDDYDSSKYLYVACDVSKRSDVCNMIEQAVCKFGQIDGIVNNAGINIPRLLVDAKEDKSKYELSDHVFDMMINVNFRGVFLCAQEASRLFVKQKKGVIINMSSESGLEGSEGQSIYAATKNALNSLTRSWAKELGKHNIRVVGVAPGIMEATGLRTLAYEEALSYTRDITIEKLREGYESTKTTPLGRSGKLSEVSDLVLFLLSDRASYIHGVTINIAGGKTRG